SSCPISPSDASAPTTALTASSASSRNTTSTSSALFPSTRSSSTPLRWAPRRTAAQPTPLSTNPRSTNSLLRKRLPNLSRHPDFNTVAPLLPLSGPPGHNETPRPPEHLFLNRAVSKESRVAISLDTEACRTLDTSIAAEWLCTNGLGGYASGTVAGANTRKYH